MFVQRITLFDFKNFHDIQLDLCEGINCFIGSNGAGKTNLLDSIYYLAFCKSFINSSDSQNVNHSKDCFAIHGKYSHKDVEHFSQVSCVFKKNKKKSFKFNGKEYDRLADHIGKIPLVMISPFDHELIYGGSDTRRRFMDGVISQYNRVYLNLILDYQKVLFQRNILLKRFAEHSYFDLDSLQIWDEQLVQLGEAIHECRKLFLDEFQEIFQYYFSKISSNKESVAISYKSDLNDSSLREALSDSISKDRLLKYTSKGIHRDDLEFYISDYPVKKFGSQGQQKSFVVAIKLAQYELLKRIKGVKPILLLDDIFDKLDDLRVEQLINLVGKETFGQVFLTDTNIDRVKRLFEQTSFDHLLFHVDNAEISKI
ncbi:MAG: DNA replication/repair protein RecF [Bacteroidales bacterium]